MGKHLLMQQWSEFSLILPLPNVSGILLLCQEPIVWYQKALNLHMFGHNGPVVHVLAEAEYWTTAKLTDFNKMRSMMRHRAITGGCGGADIIISRFRSDVNEIGHCFILDRWRIFHLMLNTWSTQLLNDVAVRFHSFGRLKIQHAFPAIFIHHLCAQEKGTCTSCEYALFMQNEIWLISFWINLHLCLNIVRLNIARWEWCAPDWFALGLPHKQCQTVYTFECWPIHYTLASAKCQSRNEGEREREKRWKKQFSTGSLNGCKDQLDLFLSRIMVANIQIFKYSTGCTSLPGFRSKMQNIRNDLKFVETFPMELAVFCDFFSLERKINVI